MTSRGIAAVALVLLASVLVQSGDAAAAPRFSAPVFSLGDVFELAVADLNGDGKPDLISAVTTDYDEGKAWVDVLLNDGAGRFRHQDRYAMDAAISGVVSADV